MSDKQRGRERDRQGMTNDGIVMNTKKQNHEHVSALWCNRKWQDYVYIQCEYKSTKQKIKHLLREENKVKENKIS